jgi:septum formation protein
VPAPRLILASRSPRRALLLRQAGYDFEQIVPAFADPAQPEADGKVVDASEHAIELAVKKAQSLCDELAARRGVEGAGNGPVVVIGADTICVGEGGKLLGQPRDIDDARRMIRGFIGGTHDVVTGVALLKVDESLRDSDRVAERRGYFAFADIVPVTLSMLSDADLEAYLATGHWRGAAGGYNLFDRQAAGWAVTIPPGADATTVVGLPMKLLTPRLAAWGVVPRPT